MQEIRWHNKLVEVAFVTCTHLRSRRVAGRGDCDSGGESYNLIEYPAMGFFVVTLVEINSCNGYC